MSLKRLRPWRPPKCRSKKVAFRSRGAANRALKRIAAAEAQAAAPSPKYPRRAYQCACGAWHLTTQEPRR